MTDDLIKEAKAGSGTPGRQPKDLLYPATDHDKIVATEALVEVMRQHQVQQGIVMNRIAEEMMKLNMSIEEKLDKMEKIFNEHCKQEIKDCGGCRVDIERQISQAEARAAENLSKAMSKIEVLIEKQDAKIVPRWVLGAVGGVILTAFIGYYGLIQFNRDYIQRHSVEAKAVEEFIQNHDIEMPNAQGIDGPNVKYTYGLPEEEAE